MQYQPAAMPPPTTALRPAQGLATAASVLLAVTAAVYVLAVYGDSSSTA
ncbi:hypothetical protein OG432_15190 [Streptomyces sp. NBC_00442]